MSEQHCFKDCPACGGTGNLPTGGDDYDECGWSKYWDESEALRKRLEAVEAVHEGLEATLPALSPVEQAIIKAYGKALKGEQCHIWLVYD